MCRLLGWKSGWYYDPQTTQLLSPLINILVFEIRLVIFLQYIWQESRAYRLGRIQEMRARAHADKQVYIYSAVPCKKKRC